MSVIVSSAALLGAEGELVEVEVEISNGLPAVNVVGLADTSIKESKERVRAAIKNSGYNFPMGRITINLAPADIRKEGTSFDLPIALAILISSNQVSFENLEEYMILGELSLSGELRKTKGILSMCLEGKEKGIKKFIVPYENLKESLLIKGIEVYPFSNLKEVIAYMLYKDLLPEKRKKEKHKEELQLDFEDVVSQESSKRALEVAAAGGHNIILQGPAGCGKTMLANRIRSILPKLSYEEALEVYKIYSSCGELNTEEILSFNRPFRNPHHTASIASIIGGGITLRPGEISLSHHGVLFLDEILEFKKNVLEVLRQPLEEGRIKISRVYGKVTYPADFMLIGGMNPCPCGFYGGATTKRCTCTDYERKRYISKLSNPLLNRIDIFSSVNLVPFKELRDDYKGESSKKIKERVTLAREIQRERFKKENITLNSQMDNKLIREYCKLDFKSNSLLEKTYERYGLSTRALSKILKVARTIADLRESERVEAIDIVEGIQYRKFINEEII